MKCEKESNMNMIRVPWKLHTELIANCLKSPMPFPTSRRCPPIPSTSTYLRIHPLLPCPPTEFLVTVSSLSLLSLVVSPTSPKPTPWATLLSTLP